VIAHTAANSVALAWELHAQDFLLTSAPVCFDEGAASLDRLLQFARGLQLPDR